MQHILFKIYSRQFSWKSIKVYDDQGNSTNIRRYRGMCTKCLSSDDFRKLANAMDRAGVKNIRIARMAEEMYLVIND